MSTRFSLALFPLLAVLAGCKGISSCNAPPTQGSDESIPPLRVPVGMEAPDTRNALRIPELKDPERPRGKSEPCLDEPPPFAVAKAATPAPAAAPAQPAAEPKAEPKSEPAAAEPKAEAEPKQ